MRSKRSRLALLAVLALALGAFAGPGTAQAAKVKETASGGVLPAESGNVSGEFVQTFKLAGGKVKKKQVLDVNVTVNGSNAANGLQGVFAVLYAPKGDNNGLNLPGFGGGSAWVNVTLDDQSRLIPCNPTGINAQIQSNCNYLQGGTWTGEFGDSLNPTFKGLNPKGEWTLHWFDSFTTTGAPTATTIGETTLEVKTGKKFAKDD